MDEAAIEMGWDPMEFASRTSSGTAIPIARGASGTEDGRLVAQVLDKCIEAGASRIQWNRRNAVAGSRQDQGRAASASRVLNAAAAPASPVRP
jgi:hypothetical protein